jgi:hypothetical protein
LEYKWLIHFPGLQLVLDLEIHSYMNDGLTQSAGARVGVHEPDVEILPDEYGTDVMPNKKSTFSLQNRK